MRIDLVLITANVDAANVVKQKKDALLDSGLVERSGNAGISFTPRFLIVNNHKPHKVLDYFLSSSRSPDGIMVLLDSDLMELAPILAPAIIFSSVEFFGAKPNFQNVIRKKFSFAIKTILALSARFVDEQYQKIMTLPVENFIAREFLDLRLLLSKEIESLSAIEGVEILSAKLRERQNPKTKTTYRDTYLIDDESRFFQVAKEHHAQAGASMPPHVSKCILSAKYRFGFKISPHRHYNVSLDGDLISGVFTDCHGDRRIINPRSHINLFPNDYYT